MRESRMNARKLTESLSSAVAREKSGLNKIEIPDSRLPSFFYWETLKRSVQGARH
jgi:hypothetical protein